MSELLSMAFSLVGGFAAGLVFFGGLWLTVRNLGTMKHPALVVFLSFFMRIALALGLIWWLSRGDIIHLALCLAGFLAARFVLIKAVRSSAPPDQPTLPSKEKNHAPEP